MNKSAFKKTIGLISCGILVLCVLSGAWWLMFRDKKAAGDDLINVAELSDEFMEEYYDAYTEMMANGKQDNVLIVVSHGEPDGHGAKEIVEGPNHTYYLMYDTSKMKELAYEALTKDNVVSVEKNEKMNLASFNSWGIEAMGIDKGLQMIGNNGNNVRVAVIDTGLDVSRFQENYPSKELTAYDVESDSYSLEVMKDTIGHGTHITGTIAEGTSGQTSIMAIRIVRGEEDIYVSDVNTAIYKAIDSGVDVINLSLGGSSYSTSQKLALDAANAENIIAVAAAGNANSSETMYPAGYDNTISVAALDQDFKRAVWDESESLGSNYNAMVDYAAPGTNIRSINGIASGTSVATPHVVTVVALLKNYNKDLNLSEVNTLLRNHVVDLGEEGKDDYYGYGMIDLNDVEFCNNTHCDEYGVFTMDAISAEPRFEIDDRTNGVAEVMVLDDGIKVTAKKACTVIVSSNDGETFSKAVAMAVEGEENTYKFAFDVADGTKATVVLKGDLDMRGTVNARDSARVKYYLLSNDNMSFNDLSALELLIVDVNNNGSVTARDVALIDYSLLSDDNLNYKALDWDTSTVSQGATGRQNARVIAYNFYSSAPTGNPGVRGQCTWYAWYWRATDPLSLGMLGGEGRNANTWHVNYAYRGVGKTPVVGSVFQSTEGLYGHVGVVTGMNEDGSMVIREMNYFGPGIISEAIIPAEMVESFNYIY